ncbi:MAG: endonuclease III [Endomicrobia bacterium]|nr:endonuclease III [Endomicrobiia bacterium]
MKKDNKAYVEKIIKLLNKDYGGIDIALNFSNPFQLLAATILSAQCTDERVNKVTPELFKRYKSIDDFAKAVPSELENYIRSAGFFRNKAKNIIGSAKMIVDKYGGKVPDNMKDLLELPGVARKTANIVLGSGFKKSEGIAVDTHVIRLANLLKLTKYEDPVKIERDLMKIVPHETWIKFPFLIQTLGRRVCKARRPACDICPLKNICPSAE